MKKYSQKTVDKLKQNTRRYHNPKKARKWKQKQEANWISRKQIIEWYTKIQS